ncbi:MAG TPA: hypothetical protein VKV32_00340 [Stellaceae bacterium]|nr:hypothetical protein [Stellaceae bacterium]
MRQIVLESVRAEATDQKAVLDRLMAAMAFFMAADSDGEAVAQIDRDLKRAA